MSREGTFLRLAGESDNESPPRPPFIDWTWARVEVLGRREYHGTAREERFLGVVFLVIRALRRDGSHEHLMFGANAIYCVREETEEEARAAVLPERHPCLKFTQPSARPGRCSRCGATEEAHRQEAENRVRFVQALTEESDAPNGDAHDPPVVEECGSPDCESCRKRREKRIVEGEIPF